MHVGIVHYAAPPIVGGVELTIFHHARVLTDLGQRVTVVAGQGAAVIPGVSFREEARVSSRSKNILEANQVLATGSVPPDFERLVAETRRALLNHLSDCDVVIGHNLFTLHKNLILTSAVYRLVEQGQGPPWVAWHHDFAWLRPQYQPELHPGDPWDLLRRAWPGVRHVTVSQAQQADLAQLYGIPAASITVVPPGVDPVNFYECPPVVARLLKTWDLFNADCVFLLPARITRRKNIELGLHWLAAVREMSGLDARLIVTGPPGPHNPSNAAYLEYLLHLRRELHLDEAVHFVYAALPSQPISGSARPDDRSSENVTKPLLLTDREVASFFQVADALFFPSRQEGFGIPILEAALVRLPIFATDLPPFRESAGPWANLFSPEMSPAEVGRIIIDTLQMDRAFQLRRRVLAHFTWQKVVETKVLPVLAEALQPSYRLRTEE